MGCLFKAARLPDYRRLRTEVLSYLGLGRILGEPERESRGDSPAKDSRYSEEGGNIAVTATEVLCVGNRLDAMVAR
jgi:hypothetical protein